MKKLMLLLGLFSLVQFSIAQNETLYSITDTEYNDPTVAYFKRVTFKIGGGVLLPQGDLKRYFGLSPLIELSLDFPVTETKSLELALQFVIPDQKESFVYVRTLDTINAKASFIFNPMLRFKKNLSQSKFSQLHLGFALGASVIKTDARNPFFTGNNQEEEKYETATAFLVSPTIDYVKTFKNNEQFTFSFGLNYTPYKIEGAVKQNIGSISFTPRIMYSF
ncbi:hypothetical protein [Olleya sp. YS]|uniref:hypothetical protein n=1 Tax=Olleya sp. YS TaxID=3028318 RepID=UPI002434237E|nr:hypothetical protein [Olleya sp. YS]WGD35308.1 hypothetical protein Ollyesu_02600 [Olleya sp. YS]